MLIMEYPMFISFKINGFKYDYFIVPEPVQRYNKTLKYA